MLKKIISALAISGLVLSLASCTSAESNQQSNTDLTPQQQQASVGEIALEHNVNQTIDSITPSSAFPQRVTAIVWHGITLLVGEVSTPELKERIVNNVHEVYGVGQMIDQIVVNPQFNPQFYDSANDTRITADIKARILITKNLSSLKFKVVTSFGRVYLLSSADQKQTQTAAALARSVVGVVSVNILTTN